MPIPEKAYTKKYQCSFDINKISNCMKDKKLQISKIIISYYIFFKKIIEQSYNLNPFLMPNILFII